jgi:hypothetical protein
MNWEFVGVAVKRQKLCNLVFEMEGHKVYPSRCPLHGRSGAFGNAPSKLNNAPLKMTEDEHTIELRVESTCLYARSLCEPG